MTKVVFDRPSVSLFTEIQRKGAKKRNAQQYFDNEKEKILHRLLTCSYDIEKVDGIYQVYFCGIEEGMCLRCYLLDDDTRKIFYKAIHLYKDDNIETQDFYRRLIKYVSYDYIIHDIALQRPSEHKKIAEKLEMVTEISEYVKLYLEYANYEDFGGVYDEFDILNNLVNNNSTEKTKEVVRDKLGDFLEYDKKCYLLGACLDNTFIKFSFSKDKVNEFKKINDRRYYEYKSRSVAEDYIDGCGFSFGLIQKAFYYFQFGNYGEQLMFVEPLDEEVYYQREYEYLGKKLRIKEIVSLQEVSVVETVLSHMSDEEKNKFFNNYENKNSFSENYGTYKQTIKKMKEYDEKRKGDIYKKSIEYLGAMKDEYINGKTEKRCNNERQM